LYKQKLFFQLSSAITLHRNNMVQPPRTKQRGQPPKGKAENHHTEGAMNAHPGATGRSHSEEGSIVHSPDIMESFETPDRVRTFDQLSQSDDELTIISKEEFSATTDQRAKPPKRSKSVHGTTSNVALHNYENGKPPPVDDSHIPWQYADPDTPYYDTVPFEGAPTTPSFHRSSSRPANTKDAIFPLQTPPPNPFYSSGADLSPPTPGDMTGFNTYMSKLRARRANKAKLKDKAVTDGSPLARAGHLSSITRKTMPGQRNIEKARINEAHTPASGSDARAENAHECDPTSVYHPKYGPATSVSPTARTEQAASPTGSSSPLWVTPQAYRFTSLEKATTSTSSKAHTSPAIINTNGRPALPSFPEHTDELITSIENVDASCLSMSDESSITNFLQDHVSSRERSVNPSPPTLDNSEIRSFGVSGPPSSELSDPPSQTGFDAFEELSVQVGAAQSNLSNGRSEFTRRVGDQDRNDALPSMNSISVGVNEATMAGIIAEKDPYYKFAEMLFDGIPKEVYEGLGDQKILQTSLSDVARWTRPRDDSFQNYAIAPDPSGAELIKVIAAVEVSLITMWAAVESMAVLLYAELNGKFIDAISSGGCTT
jgi:hypothetical protein